MRDLLHALVVEVGLVDREDAHGGQHQQAVVARVEVFEVALAHS